VIRAETAYPFSDLALARRLERAEASRNAAFVEARAELQPELKATWTKVAGAYAMFDGVGSPLTQSFGLGLFQTVGPAEMQALENFFRERGAEVFHEISPIADPSLLTLLNERGYQPVELTSVLVRPTAVASDPVRSRDERIVVRGIDPGEEDLWARVAAEGWGEIAELAAFVREIGEVMARSKGSFCFLAELEGQPIAAAALGLADGVALLAGASTIPAARKRGAQLALLQARLRFAADRGCDLAMMGAQPGSTSQRNAEREGFPDRLHTHQVAIASNGRVTDQREGRSGGLEGGDGCERRQASDWLGYWPRRASCGRSALHGGHLEGARSCLLAAGHTPGSPQLNSFGPSMSFAREMLEAGEREPVLEYLKSLPIVLESRPRAAGPLDPGNQGGANPRLRTVAVALTDRAAVGVDLELLVWFGTQRQCKG